MTSTFRNRTARLAARFCLCTAIGAAAAIGLGGPAHGDEIAFQAGTVTMQSRSKMEIRDELRALAERPAERHFLLQTARPMTAFERTALAATGVQLLRPLGSNAWFASVEPGFRGAMQAADLQVISDVSAIDISWKLHAHFIERGIPEWAVVDEGPALTNDRGAQERNPTIAVYILFHADVDLMPEGWLHVAMHGGRVVSELKTVNGLVVEMPYLLVDALADNDIVQYIEPALPKLAELNNSNRDRVGAGTAQDPPYGLDGSGVSVLVYDGGFGFSGHGDFGGRHTTRDTAGLSDHATHVAGTIGGDGSGSGGLYRGMAPGVTLESYGFEQVGGLQEGFLYTDPGDLEADYDEAINTYGADIANNSIGTNTATNGFPCDWEGNYGITSALIDSIVRGSLGQPFRIVWANGNERQSSRCFGIEGYPGEYHTTAPPACAKNHIAVGALNSNDDSMTSFSSWGPADDGRLKPDISAPGCQSDDDNTVTSCSSSGGYTGKCGTSMACPTVTGLSALILQDYRLNNPGLPDFRNSTLKAVLAHTAVDLGNPGPDYQFGYGSVRVVDAIDLMRAANSLEGEVDQGDTYSVLVTVNPGDTELRVTIAWDDVPGTPNVSPALVNDLDLKVFDPGGVQQHVWTLDPLVPSANAVQTGPDHLNNIEQVFIANPTPGVYRVDVVGFNVSVGPQSFSLAASPVLIDCSSRGFAANDAISYACNSVATLRVVDCDLNTDDGVIETVTVTISSDSEPDGEVVLLTETGPETSAFEGAIPLVTSEGGNFRNSRKARIDVVGGPGSGQYAHALLVQHGDVVRTTYIDADDGEGGQNVEVTSLAGVDCEVPMIISISTTDIEPRSATVVVDANEIVRATVRYGTDCSNLIESASSSAFGTNVQVSLTGLTDDTDYYYAVDLVDQAGNTISLSNGGSCYGFTTPEVPDFFTEQFAGDIDIDGLSLTFIPNGSVDFYAACATPIIALPTDPAGGTVLSLIDDDSEIVPVTGNSVHLYGVPYSSIHVCSNGFITFTGTDTDYTETLPEHFGTPRIAALWHDLNPTAGGTVSWQQHADRLVVTWENVAEYSTTNSNTFQVELFFDGTIQMSWLGIDLGACIVGLSEGLGSSPDFFETDHSAAGSCGPRPPLAGTVEVSTPVDTPVQIQLLGSDDGLPDPPAALTYIVTSLPGQELRDAGTNQVITLGDLPYTIAAGADLLTYTPSAFQGADSFTYVVDDGGVPPDGGQSSTGNVNIIVGGPQPIYVFPLDTDPGWATTGQWAFGIPTGGGTHSGDPNGGNTGTNVYGYNLSGDYPNNMAVETLTTGVIDCSTITGTELKFWRWLGVESATYDHAGVEVSSNGTTWTPVWNHTGGAVDESAWTQHSFDISAVADGQSTVFIRWTMGTTDGSVTYPGWNLDDVEIHGIVPLSAVGEVNGDGLVDAQDVIAVLASFGCGACPADVNHDGIVDANDLLAVLAGWSGAGGAGADLGPARRVDPSDRDTIVVQLSDADVFVNTGVLAPARHGGVVEVARHFRQTADGVLDIQITGMQPVEDYDVLIVPGAAELDGLATVHFDHGFEPHVGDRFTFLVADAIVGSFDEVQFPSIDGAVLELIVDTGAVTLCVTDGECIGGSAGTVSGDLNGDGVVDVSDVRALLQEWGADPSIADVNGDGSVDGHDLRELLDAR